MHDSGAKSTLAAPLRVKKAKRRNHFTFAEHQCVAHHTDVFFDCMFFVAEANVVKCLPVTPGKRGPSNGVEIKVDLQQFYKDVGLDQDAKQVITIPIAHSPKSLLH